MMFSQKFHSHRIFKRLAKALIRLLVWAFVSRTYYIIGILMSQLLYFQSEGKQCGSWSDGFIRKNQMASLEATWSGSTVFSKKGQSRLRRIRFKYLDN